MNTYNYLHLVIPYENFVEEYAKYQHQLNELIKDEALSLVELKNSFNQINEEIIKLLQTSFNERNNIFYGGYINAKEHRYNLGAREQTIQDIKKDIESKVLQIGFDSEYLDIFDLIKNPSDELFRKRQKFTVQQKEDFILIKLSKLNSRYHHSIAHIYYGTGLKEVVDRENFSLGKQLEQNGYVKLIATKDGANAQITLEGIKYIESLNEEAYGLYEVDGELSESEKITLEKDFNDLYQKIRDDMNTQFKDQQEFLVMSLNALYEVLDESLQLIDSKLPKNTIRQAIFGKILEKAGDKGLEYVMGKAWVELKGKLAQNPDFLETIEKMSTMLNPQKLLE